MTKAKLRTRRGRRSTASGSELLPRSRLAGSSSRSSNRQPSPHYCKLNRGITQNGFCDARCFSWTQTEPVSHHHLSTSNIFLPCTVPPKANTDASAYDHARRGSARGSSLSSVGLSSPPRDRPECFPLQQQHHTPSSSSITPRAATSLDHSEGTATTNCCGAPNRTSADPSSAHALTRYALPLHPPFRCCKT